MTSTFNMADINVHENDLLMATTTLNQMLEIKRYARKRIFHGCENIRTVCGVDRKICPRVTVWHHEALPTDAKH